MKIKVEIDATPQEVREFFGLPDIRPLQEELLSEIRANMKQRRFPVFDALNLMKTAVSGTDAVPWRPCKKRFWDAFANRDLSDDEGDKSEH